VRAFVTGAAGFIGSNLVDRLLADGHEVTGFDNLSTGFLRFLEGAQANPRFRLIEVDLLELEAVTRAMTGADFVFHLAANADVRFGPDHPRRDLEQNTIVTWNVLEAMRAAGVRRIAFASTGSVYGEPEIFPTPETAPFPVQTSLCARRNWRPRMIAACHGVRIPGGSSACVDPRRTLPHGHVVDLPAITPSERLDAGHVATSHSRAGFP
jgi:nucleoside-diphosphate-sugar epimerase